VANAKLLLVDDDAAIRSSLASILKLHDFDTRAAATVSEALYLISTESFDVLVSDLHMPGAGDGLTVISAMRHANPKAVTLLLSAFPEMNAAANAILLQTDEILVKPMDVLTLVAVIKQRLMLGPPRTRIVETVAGILERSVQDTIDHWLQCVLKEPELMTVVMTSEQRTLHLPQLFQDLVDRLRSSRELGSKEILSPSASAHGLDRRRRGYTAAMLVEESRMLQVSIFATLQKNLSSIDFSVVLIGVMAIADEVDSQLSQAMKSYIAESHTDALTA
jgi:DNA-binding response OmpR family regulator